MFFSDMLFLSVLFTSAYATSIYPLFAVRQTGAQCVNQCFNIVNQVESGQCNIQCLCSETMVEAIQTCQQCGLAGEPYLGLGPNYIQTLKNDCAAAGYPISAGSTGGPTGGSSSSSDGLSGTGTGSASARTTNSGSTTLGSTGTTLGGSATSTTTTASTGTGSKRSSATGLIAQLGAIAAAGVAGVIILAA